MVPFLGLSDLVGIGGSTSSCTILPEAAQSSTKNLLFLVVFLIPCSIIICCYTCIYCTVWRQRQISIYEITPDSVFAAARQQRERENKRLTITIMLIFAGFMMCFLPLMLVHVVDINNNYPELHICGSILAWASNVINPFICVISNGLYRDAWYRLLSTMKCCVRVPNKSLATKNIAVVNDIIRAWPAELV